MCSRLLLPASSRNYAGSFNSRAFDGGQVLTSGHTLLPHGNDAGHDTEGYLRRHKPNPLNVIREQRIEKLHNRAQQTQSTPRVRSAPARTWAASHHRASPRRWIPMPCSTNAIAKLTTTYLNKLNPTRKTSR